jgi:hypothetical protein
MRAFIHVEKKDPGTMRLVAGAWNAQELIGRAYLQHLIGFPQA